jgi:uncharacterized protein YkwD
MPLLRFRAGRSGLPAAALLVLAVALLATLPAARARASETHAFVAEVNEARAAHGLRQLRVAASLRRSSFHYAHRMLGDQQFRHLDAIRLPHRFGLRGEVLARMDPGHESAEKVVRRWLASPSHRAVLLNRRFRFIGVGLAPGRLGGRPVTLVTGHFGGARKARR